MSVRNAYDLHYMGCIQLKAEENVYQKKAMHKCDQVSYKKQISVEF